MTASKAKLAAIVAAAVLIIGGAIITSIATSAASSAARPAAQPRPATDSHANTPEVRAAAIEICTAAGNCDQPAVEALLLVESPEYGELADALRQLVEDARVLRTLIQEKLGPVPEEIEQYMPGGPAGFRKQYLPNAPVRFTADTARIDLGPGNTPSAFVFRRHEGKWKLIVGQSFCGGDQEKANGITIRLMRVGEVMRSTTESLKAGEFTSMKDLADQLAQQMQAIAGN